MEFLKIIKPVSIDLKFETVDILSSYVYKTYNIPSLTVPSYTIVDADDLDININELKYVAIAKANEPPFKSSIISNITIDNEMNTDVRLFVTAIYEGSDISEMFTIGDKIGYGSKEFVIVDIIPQEHRVLMVSNFLETVSLIDYTYNYTKTWVRSIAHMQLDHIYSNELDNDYARYAEIYMLNHVLNNYRNELTNEKNSN